MLLSSSRFIRIAPKRTVLELCEEGPEVWPANFLSTGSLWPRGDVAVDRTRQSDWHLKSIWAAARASNSASGVWPCTARLARQNFPLHAVRLQASQMPAFLRRASFTRAQISSRSRAKFRTTSEASQQLANGYGRPAESLLLEPDSVLSGSSTEAAAGPLQH